MFSIYYKGENPLQMTTPVLGRMCNGRDRTILDAQSKPKGELREQPPDGKQILCLVQRALHSLRIPKDI